MMRKGFLALTAIALAASIIGGGAEAAAPARSDVQVIMEGKRLSFPDAKPYMDGNNRTLVPVRFVSEALGAKVVWHADVQRVDIALEGKYISLTIGESRALLNGEEISFDTSAVVREGRTFVPLRFVSETLGQTVEWDGASRYVWIGEKVILTPEEKGIEPKPFSEVFHYFENYDWYQKDSRGDPFTQYYDLSIDDLPIKIEDFEYISMNKITMDGYDGVTTTVRGGNKTVPPIFYVTDSFRPRYRYFIKPLVQIHEDQSVTGTFRVVEATDYDIHGDKNYLSFKLKDADYIGMSDLSPIMVLIRNPFK